MKKRQGKANIVLNDMIVVSLFLGVHGNSLVYCLCDLQLCHVCFSFFFDLTFVVYFHT